MAKRIRRKNTVAGTRRGSKWPPEVKLACMADLLLTDNLTEVAQRRGVPESTLRTWKAQAQKEGRASVWSQARQEAAREIAMRASQGARLNVEYLLRRMEAAQRAEQAMEEIRAQLRELGPQEDNEDAEKNAQRVQLQHRLLHYRGLSDFSATNILRTLVAVEAKVTGGQESGPQSYEDLLQGVLGEEF